MRYTAPGPPDLEPVIIALDDPMRVSREAVSGSPPWLLIGSVILLVAGILGLVRHRRKDSRQEVTSADAEDNLESNHS